MVDHAGNGWAALGWDVNPMLIGITLAEIAEIAGDVDPALRWDAAPRLTGVTLAETAETPANRAMRKRVRSRQEGTALQSPCFYAASSRISRTSPGPSMRLGLRGTHVVP